MITIDRQNNKTLYARIKWALLAKGNCSTDSREYVLRLYAHVDEKGYLTTTDGLRLHRVKTDIDAGVYKVMETKDTILLDPVEGTAYPDVTKLLPDLGGIDNVGDPSHQKLDTAIGSHHGRMDGGELSVCMSNLVLTAQRGITYDFLKDALSCVQSFECYIPKAKGTPFVFDGVDGTHYALIMPLMVPKKA